MLNFRQRITNVLTGAVVIPMSIFIALRAVNVTGQYVESAILICIIFTVPALFSFLVGSGFRVWHSKRVTENTTDLRVMTSEDTSDSNKDRPGEKSLEAQLLDAIDNGDLSKARNLLNQGAKVDNGSTPISHTDYAKLHKNFDMLNLLESYTQARNLETVLVEGEQVIDKFKLGRAYLFGDGVERNLKAALDLLCVSVANGYYQALPLMNAELSEYTLELTNLDYDRYKDFTDRWIKIAASQGNLECKFLHLHEVSDTQERADILKKLSVKGHQGALMYLAMDYESGTNGFDKDIYQALLYWKELASMGNADAQYSIATTFHYGNGVIGRDKHEACRWYAMLMKNKNNIFEMGKEEYQQLMSKR